MNYKTIFLIRHAQTDLNVSKTIQGRLINSKINFEGEQQSLLLFKKLQNIHFDKIYLTSLQRTYQTMIPFIIQKKISYEILPEFDELSFGITEGKQIYDKFGNSELFDYFKNWKNGNFDYKIPQGESPNEAFERVRIGFEKILNLKKEKTIIICSHQRIIRIMLCFILNKSLLEMDNFGHDNTSYSVLNYYYKNKKFYLCDLNNSQHLIMNNEKKKTKK